MARRYQSPVLLSDMPPVNPSQGFHGESIHELKDDISTSFVYGDDNYEEEYIVPDVVKEVTASDSGSIWNCSTAKRARI